MGVLSALNPFKHKEDTSLQFKRDLTTAAVHGDAAKPNSPEADYLAMVGKMGFMVMDENIINFLYSNSLLHPFIPVFSPLNSTIKLDKQQAELKRIRLENFIVERKLTMPPETYDSNGLEVLDGLRIFGHDRVSEAMDGWKGHLVTEQVKVIETRTPEKKGWFR